MSNAQHTPGPWVHVTDYGQVGSVETTDGIVVAQTQAMVNDHTRSQRNANARLIAAAPELLDALKLLLEHAEGLIAEEYPKSMHKEQMAQFDSYRAAIAKATGGAA